MLRKTMSVITSMQPDGEIALDIQLKHAARRALANRVTAGYGKADPQWAKEFDNQLQLAAARKLGHLLKARGQGEEVAIGPGRPGSRRVGQRPRDTGLRPGSPGPDRG